MNTVSENTFFYNNEMFILEKQWASICINDARKEGREERFERTLGAIKQYISNNSNNLEPVQLHELESFHARVVAFRDNNTKEVNAIKAKVCSFICAELRARTAIKGVNLKMTFLMFRFYSRTTGDTFCIGRGIKKDIIGKGQYKTVKGGMQPLIHQRVVYITSRGYKNARIGMKEFKFLSLFKGCEGIAQIYCEMTSLASAKRIDRNKHVMIGVRYDGDLGHLDKQSLTKFDQRQMAADMGMILYHLEQKRIVHQDMKPSNFLYYIDPVSRLKRLILGDFGLAAKVSKREGGIAGTPCYFSPLQAYLKLHLRGKESRSSFKHEVWAASLTLYEVFVKRPEHMKTEKARVFFTSRSALSANWVDEDMKNMTQKQKDLIDPELLALIKRGLDPNENTRISINEFSEKLRALSPSALQQGEGSSSSSTSALGKRKRESDSVQKI